MPNIIRFEENIRKNYQLHPLIYGMDSTKEICLDNMYFIVYSYLINNGYQDNASQMADSINQLIHSCAGCFCGACERRINQVVESGLGEDLVFTLDFDIDDAIEWMEKTQ